MCLYGCMCTYVDTHVYTYVYYVYHIRMHNAYCALCAHVCDYFICNMYVYCANNFCKDSKQN